MHSCPKKTSEAMFDWMATTPLKTFFERTTILIRAPFWVFFLYTGTELEMNKKPPYLPQSNVTVENRVALER